MAKDRACASPQLFVPSWIGGGSLSHTQEQQLFSYHQLQQYQHFVQYQQYMQEQYERYMLYHQQFQQLQLHVQLQHEEQYQQLLRQQLQQEEAERSAQMQEAASMVNPDGTLFDEETNPTLLSLMAAEGGAYGSRDSMDMSDLEALLRSPVILRLPSESPSLPALQWGEQQQNHPPSLTLSPAALRDTTIRTALSDLNHIANYFGCNANELGTLNELWAAIDSHFTATSSDKSDADGQSIAGVNNSATALPEGSSSVLANTPGSVGRVRPQRA
ncbi:hypothetical protein RI367_008825 [Sorochytrium milnesiophthora]